MSIVTSYPGIYIREDATLNLSVAQTITAVPAFLFAGEVSPLSSKIVRFTSWPEVDALNLPPENEIYVALRLWFSLSGGICYAVDQSEMYRLDAYDEITLLVANGTMALYDKFETVCTVGSGCFALLDGPRKKIESGEGVMRDFPASAFAAAWYPWLKVGWSKSDIPPSVAAAIGIAITDRTRGVWKAPANISLKGLTPIHSVSDDLQGRLNNGKAMNMIREFPSTGTTLWGGRTLEDSDQWRYISVRRLFNSIEKDITRALGIAVFEPNNQPTWQSVKAAIDIYLHGLWRQGALAGDTPADAWFVKVGKDITMSETDIKQGRLIVNIGVAAVRPAEFIIIELSQNINQR